jgi:glutaminyl-tRNA synthetase
MAAAECRPGERVSGEGWRQARYRPHIVSAMASTARSGIIMSAVEATAETAAGRDFIRDIVAADLAAGRCAQVVTRFPPEPNGYLHICHAKSICLNFGVAEEFGGSCHLRFDDTNPTKEEQEYIDAIERDVRWLGFDWGPHLYHASDYFDQLYRWAEHLIETGLAYVDDQSPDEIRAARGTLTEPGRDSPYRARSADENLALFRRMRAGEFPNGARVLRAKIDMTSGNMNLRDPVLYRILHASHPRTGSAWCIYPTYDFAHGQSDAIEGITHSICTLEFEDHRPLYEWLIDHLPVPARPRQYEFARLNLGYAVLSKRFLTRLVQEGWVSGWDDPRMPTLAGLRRRGVPPEAIRDFVRRIGVARANSLVDVAIYESAVRDVLNRAAPRRMAVLRPLKLVIENYPAGRSEELDAVNMPDDPAAGTRRIPFGRELYIEREDFVENPPRNFHRLAPGREVRLRYAYFVTCRDIVKNEAGEVVELRCTYDPATRGGTASDGRKVRGTIHWVSAAEAVPAEIRLYNPLFTRPDPGADGHLIADLNPDSLEVLEGALVEPGFAADNLEETVQFERQGYFCRDPDSAPGRLVFNRTIGLRDTWAKSQAGGR